MNCHGAPLHQRPPHHPTMLWYCFLIYSDLNTGLGSSKSNTNCNGDVRLRYNPFWNFSSSQDKGYGGWYVVHLRPFWPVTTHVHNVLLVRVVTGLPPNLPIRLPKHADEDGYAAEGIPLRSAADGIPLRSPRATDSFRSSWCPAEICMRTQIVSLEGSYPAGVSPIYTWEGNDNPPFTRFDTQRRF
jgi:hypothetical protein